MSTLALQLIAKEKKEKTGILDLGNCGLTELPEELFELDHLRVLYLNYDRWDWDKREWVKSKNRGRRNGLVSISKEISKLASLLELQIHEQKIVDFSALSDCTHLLRINLSSNQISDYSFLEKLTSLQSLDLSSNQISDYSFLEKLTSLQSLYLRSNQISDYSFLEKLTSLQSLDLSYNQISDISFLEKLTSLQSLDLRYNQISDISFLEKLTSLQSLDLSSNQISNVSLFFFENFQDFNLDEFGGSGLSLGNNPITSPPIEILEQGRQSVLEWFEAHKKQLQEIKIILIGDPKAGKTSLLRRLKEDTFDEQEEQTDGINIESIAFGECESFQAQTSIHDLTGHFWDFGGQEIMNATHQFFLTNRSVYVLILDARKDNEVANQIRRWVKKIIATGGNSPIIIVSNKIDINSGFGFENEYELQQEFPQIKSFLKISSKTKENIKLLKEQLAEMIPQAELFHTEIDERWIAIKEQLQKETAKEHFLNEKRFLEICREHRLHQKDGQRNAIRFLHDLGLVLHFEEVNLAEYYVLDPYWITYGVYQIVTSKYAGEQKGKVPMNQLKYIVNEEEDKETTYQTQQSEKIIYSNNEARFLVDILHQFKLCFYLPGRKHFILPDLLDTQEPIKLTVPIRESTDSIQFVYEYEYLPKSIIPYIMVESNKVLEATWRTGCIIQAKDNRALISNYQNRLRIIVTGMHKSKREFMSIVRFLIDTINRDLRQHPNMMIPLPDNMGLADYEELLEKERDGETYHRIYKPEKRKFEINKLLEGISAPNDIRILKRQLEQVLQNQTEIIDTQDAQMRLLSEIHCVSFFLQEGQERLEAELNSLNPPDLNQLNKILDAKLAIFVKEIPSADEITERWKELNSKDKARLDSKLKVKMKMDLFFLAFEKELAYDTKPFLENWKKGGLELKEWLRGERTFKQLFIEEKMALEEGNESIVKSQE